MKNIDTLISFVKPYALKVDANNINNNEKYTAIELLLGPRNTVNIPP